MEKFGDLVAAAAYPLKPPAKIDRFDILAALAVRYGVNQDVLLKKLSGSDVLACICRDAFGLQEFAKPPAKKGRRRDAEAGWELFKFAVTAKQADPNITYAAIARKWIEIRDGSKGLTSGQFDSRVDAARKRLERFGEALPQTSPLALLYMDGLPLE